MGHRKALPAPFSQLMETRKGGGCSAMWTSFGGYFWLFEHRALAELKLVDLCFHLRSLCIFLQPSSSVFPRLVKVCDYRCDFFLSEAPLLSLLFLCIPRRQEGQQSLTAFLVRSPCLRQVVQAGPELNTPFSRTRQPWQCAPVILALGRWRQEDGSLASYPAYLNQEVSDQ